MPMPSALRDRRIVSGRPAAIQAIALARDLVAHARLQVAVTDLPEAIHQTRLVLKALRALLRLLRSPEGRRPPDRLDATFKELGRKLSPTRDRDVAASTLLALVGKRGNPAQKSAAKRWIGSIRHSMPSHEALASVAGAMARALPSLVRRLRAVGNPEAIVSGLLRSLQRARRWQRRALETGKPDAFHSWRRWQKRIETQLRWVHPSDRRGMRSLLGALHDQQEALGQLHDLDVLAGLLSAKDPGLDAKLASDARKLLPLVLVRQRRLKSRLSRRDARLPVRTIQRAIREVRRGW